MSKGNIGVTSDNIFPVIKKFLYSDHEIFLRELISNAVDATQKLKTLSSVGEAKGDLGDLRVRVSLDKAKKTLTVSDHGIGMTAEEVDKYINQIAFSGAEEFVNQYKDKAEAISAISVWASTRRSWWPTRWRYSARATGRMPRPFTGAARAVRSTQWRIPSRPSAVRTWCCT